MDPLGLALRLHARKTEHYVGLVARGGAPLKPGLTALLARARSRGLALATTTSLANVEALFAAELGESMSGWFQVRISGDMVAAKKPAPDVYLKALEALRIEPHEALAVEDSQNGVRSASGAGLTVAAIASLYSVSDDFSEATYRMGRLLEIAAFLD